MAGRVGVVNVGWAPWTVPYEEALAAVSEESRAAIKAAGAVGWKLTHVYTDLAARMTRGHLAIFVGRDGRVTRPQTSAGLRAQAELHEAGLKLRG